MSPYDSLYPQLVDMGLVEWSEQIKQIVSEKLALDNHGKMEQWQQALNLLPTIEPSQLELKDRVEIGNGSDLKRIDKAQFIEMLKQFHPWRKGPYSLLGVEIDTEWHSDWKWDRILPHIQPLSGRKVLDVGGGNGYHGWRMLGEGAKLVIGIDPTLVFVMQFHAIQRYIGQSNHYVLPLGIEHLPDNLACFDTVFSMGILYHRRSPLDHLYELRSCLRPGGELVLETLIVEGEEGHVLVPEGRYAKMRNIWFFPAADTLLLWLRRCGFKNVRCVESNATTVEEQRATAWMTFESLADFLDPSDPTKTIEGHPAPIRATFIATAPGDTQTT
ncbi:MAG: tRNA 5-methoxyuridine(34)/uridine 5-oxyacetic acid(34) synthase CmoB [Methylophaga sp.]|nr:tRNA 5-methoxyuridine(34)/uridine 5-oxyacetic acid(34) synthase CmoB [Methylophaga sp.]